jgi:hypothetical protein
VAADPADMDEHRQPDLISTQSNRLLSHTGDTSRLED